MILHMLEMWLVLGIGRDDTCLIAPLKLMTVCKSTDWVAAIYTFY